MISGSIPSGDFPEKIIPALTSSSCIGENATAAGMRKDPRFIFSLCKPDPRIPTLPSNRRYQSAGASASAAARTASSIFLRALVSLIRSKDRTSLMTSGLRMGSLEKSVGV